MFNKLSKLFASLGFMLVFGLLISACGSDTSALWTPDPTVSARLTATKSTTSNSSTTLINTPAIPTTIASTKSVSTPNPNGLDYLNFWWPVGDSKTVGTGDDVTPKAVANATPDLSQVGYPPLLTPILVKTTNANWAEMTRYAVGGYTVAQSKAGIDAALTLQTSTPKFVLINLGINNGQTNYVTITPDYLYILDAIHTKWPTTKIYCAKIWGPGRDKTLLNNINSAITAAVTARSTFAYPGIDEIFLEGGDGGKTYLLDGTHPNHAGYVLTAQKWAQILGY